MNYNEVMKRFFTKYSSVNLQSSDGKINVESMDAIINYTSNGKFKTYQSLLDSFVNDLNSAHNNRWSVEKFCETYCGTNFKNDDVGAIGGYDVGGTTTKNAFAVVSDVAMSQWKLPTTNRLTIDGCTFVFDKISNLTAKEQYLLKGLNSSWLKGALQTLKDGYGLSFNSSSANCKTITVKFVSENSKRAAWVAAAINKTSGKATRLELYINTYLTFDTTSVDGKIEGNFVGENLLDRTLAHELSHACMYSVGTFGNQMPVALSEGISELLVGIDDTRKSYVTTALSKSNVATFAKGMALNATSVADQIKYGGSVALLRYLIQQSATPEYAFTDDSRKEVELLSTYNNTSFSIGSIAGITDVKVSNHKKVNEIIGSSSANKINVTSTSVKVTAGAGNDVITIKTSPYSIIYGQTGNDTISITDSDTVKVYGEDGVDTISISNKAGHSVSGGANNDTITLYNVASSTIYGNTGSDKIVVRNKSRSNTIYGNEDNDDISIIDGDHNIVRADAGTDKVTLTTATYSTVYGGIGNDTFTLGTNSNNNTIRGEDGNDTFTSRDSTNNIFYGGNGTDTFTIYGGTQTIYGEAGTDKITITSGTSHKIEGNAGNDTIVLTDIKGSTIHGNAGTDSITFKSGTSNKIYADEDADTITISGGSSNTFFAGSGNDKVTITAGSSNIIDGEVGADTITVSAGSTNTIKGGADADTLTISGGTSHKLYGGKGNDKITISNGSKNSAYGEDDADIIYVKGGTSNGASGGIGNDKLYLSGGTSNTISGEAGNDTLEVSGGTKGQALGGDGVDTITVKAGTSYTVHGNAGNDIITVTGGSSNKFYGDAGNDTFTIKGGTKDIFYAGAGSNIFNIDSSLFKGQSTISLKGLTASAVNTFKFTGALAKYNFSKSGNNLVVAYASYKITIEDFMTHKSSVMYFADGTKRNFSFINKKIK